MNNNEIRDEMVQFLPGRRGHFQLESGHHGELWLELELLCLQVEPVKRFAALVAERLAGHRVEVLCGPLNEGAFVALMVAEKLGVPFTYAERFVDPEGTANGALYPVRYRLPRALRSKVCGKRVGIVNDVINAGSAIRGTFADLKTCGAEVVAIATLVILGEFAAKFRSEHKIALETLAFLPNKIWEPAECPLCAQGVRLMDLLA
jgi:orotate phosphoribosyltransferase